MGNNYSTLISWAATVTLVGACYLYYSQNQPRGARARGRSLNRPGNTTTGKGEALPWSDSESKKSAKKPRKSVKKAVQETGQKAEAYLSGASTTGADADDDLSPAASPTLGASENTPSGRDVSDMLEPKAPSSNVLNITASEKPASQKKQQPKRPETPQESKKQRQNRRKAEEAKAQREADEIERKKLQEKQRRTAREARGSPAKNGLQSAKAPTSNPWASGRPASSVAPAPVTNAQLLDTFDPEVASTASSSEAGATNGTAPTPDSMGNSHEWANNLSEEEQMKIIAEMNDSWSTVPASKKQRKNKAAVDGAEESADTGAVKPAAPTKASAKQENRPYQPQSRYALLESE